MASYVSDGENGLLVQEGDARALRGALERLVGDAGLRERLGRNARQYAQQHLDAEKLGEKLANFFKRL
jgi:glycosyltransferase involved in cell wall biosynthesis